MPDVDLFVRSSGEQRTSNFLLWQSAYAELVFLDTLWPDFTRENLWHARRPLLGARPALRWSGRHPDRLSARRPAVRPPRPSPASPASSRDPTDG